jgi:3-hydroxyisobutyrate dehydrogenase-like beta-hydroxyacid dehydrogenase
MVKKVGFIGLGDIGLPMAKRVASHGYEVTVCGHVRREPIEEMKKVGAREVNSPKEVASASDVTITMVRDVPQSQEVILGPNGVMEGSRKGSGIIIMSTLPPQFCQEVAQAGKRKGVDVLDAPVSGTRLRAADGTLTLMVGGEVEVIEKYRPVLETMGKIVHCGGVGTGEIAKLANNMALLNNIVGLVEALEWGTKCGATEEQLIEIMKTSTGDSVAVRGHFTFKENFRKYKPHILPGEVPSLFTLAVKDLEIALRIADEMELSIPLTALTHHLIPRLKFYDVTAMRTDTKA